ncbi:LAAT1 protein, partial [Atractosteus spatula]|nr:LAAT1 protein [Atractosteus spatula]
MWEYWSVVIGLVSMLCFLLSTLPQVYEAYRHGRVEQAVSLGFLLFLLSGDLSNFIGCYLTNQLPIQIVTAVFYIFTDVILISQFLYYKLKNAKSQTFQVLLNENAVLFFRCVMCQNCIFMLCKMIFNLSLQQNSTNVLEISGYAFGYLSSVFYLASRFPQLYKNFKRQSTEGTSYLLFALAMMGNGTYGLSLIVMLPALKGSEGIFILNHLAWLIGSLGVLFLDFFVSFYFETGFGQF